MDPRIQQALAELEKAGVEASLGQEHDYLEARRTLDIQRSCSTKIRHESELAAKKHIHSLKRGKAVPRLQWFNVYSCPHCSGWHIARSRIEPYRPYPRRKRPSK